jgi:AcrR family transcriptional regulator
MADIRRRKSGISERRSDARAVRTRSLALGAFRDLVLEQPFDEVSFGAVAKRAKVGRSTLYEHFAGKSALLASSIAGPFACLAGALDEKPRVADLARMLEHFWENRALARRIFCADSKRRVEAVLTQLVQEKLQARGFKGRAALLLPPKLAAASLAQLLLAPIVLWLEGESAMQPQDLAYALMRAAQSALHALRTSPTTHAREYS